MATSLTWVLALALRSTVVVAVALALVALLRRRRVVACYGLLTLAAVSLLLLPVLPGVLPRWELRLPRILSVEPGPQVVEPLRRWDAPRSAEVAPTEAAHHAVSGPTSTVSREGVESPGVFAVPALSLGAAVSTLWLTGLFISLLGLLGALRREGRLLSASRPLEGPWAGTLAEVRHSIGVSRPVRLLACEGIDSPMTIGWWRPAVLVPLAAARWSEERRRVVVQHELVHVRRGDALRHLLWRLVVAVYWFHPLARLAAREASVVGEHACDRTVLELGTRPSAYARQLLEIAESLSVSPRFGHALPMVERSQLARRLNMILDHERSVGRGRALAAVSAALLVGTVAVVGAAGPVKSAAPAPDGEEPTRSATASAPAPAATPATPARAAQPAPAASTASGAAPGACLEGTNGSFSGFFSHGPSGSEGSATEDANFTLQHRLGNGRRLCARVKGRVRFDERDGSIRDLPPGSSVSVETRGRSGSQVMRVTGEQGGSPRHEWWLDGASRPVDDAARAWLAHALEVMAGYRAIGSIQGQVGSLQGEIGSIQGQVGSLQGQIGSIQGRIGTLQGKVGSILGERGAMEGRIGGEEGAIGGLEGRRWQASAAEKARIDQEIATHRAEIEKLRAEKSSRQFDRRIADAEAELRAEEKKARDAIAALERKIEDVRADEKIAALNQKIADLHAEDRIAEIEQRLKPALERLQADMDRLGS